MSFTDAERVRRAALSHASTSGAEIEAAPPLAATVDATIVLPPAFEVAAGQLAAAEASAARAAEAVHTAQAKLDTISGRAR